MLQNDVTFVGFVLLRSGKLALGGWLYWWVQFSAKLYEISNHLCGNYKTIAYFDDK
jgi:hypothetical protein